ncbi:hypothetical protein RUND412_005169 [Rhizina undulata]
MEELTGAHQEDFSAVQKCLREGNPFPVPPKRVVDSSETISEDWARASVRERLKAEYARTWNPAPKPIPVFEDGNKSSLSWNRSSVNILNKTDSLDPDLPDAIAWDILAVKNATVFVARPKGIGLPIGVTMLTGKLQRCDGPERAWHPAIYLENDVYQSDALQWTPWTVNRAPVCQFLSRALTHWSKGIKDFKQLYEKLSMGSVIYVTLCSLDPRKCSVDLQMGNYKVERFLLSCERLKKLWCYTGSEIKQLPPVLDLKELKFKDWVHDKMMIVTIKNGGPQVYGFKTIAQYPEVMYSELRTFLRMPPHPNIIGPPCYLISKSTLFSQVTPVDPVSSIYDPKPTIPICGFLVPYLGGVNLDIEVRKRVAAGNLPMRLRIKWCRQLADTMYHVCHHGAGINKNWYHRRLRMSDVFVSPDDDIILRDLENEGDWEVLPASNIDFSHEDATYRRFYEVRQESIIRASRYGHQCWDLWVSYKHLGEDRAYCLVNESTLENFCPAHWERSPVNILNFPETEPGHFTHRPGFYDGPWIKSTRRETEYHMVYRLGQCLWYIIHGIGNWRFYEFEKGKQRHEGNWPYWDKGLKYDIPKSVRMLIKKSLEKCLYKSDASSISEFYLDDGYLNCEELHQHMHKSFNKRPRLGMALLTLKKCETDELNNEKISDVNVDSKDSPPESLATMSDPGWLPKANSVYDYIYKPLTRRKSAPGPSIHNRLNEYVGENIPLVARVERWRGEIEGDTSMQGYRCTKEARPEKSGAESMSLSEMVETERKIKEAMQQLIAEPFLHRFKYDENTGDYY